MSFVRFVFLILGTIVFNTVLERFPLCIFGEFYRSLKYVRNFPRSYVGELESLGEGAK